jgi:RimJ/RimL family protein N-acetyltransferase
MGIGFFEAPEQYRTDRFLLRSYEVGDGPRLAEATNHSYEHLRPFMPWAVPYQSDEDGEYLARRFRARYLTSEDFTLGIFSLDGSQLLGGTGYHLREGAGLKNESAEIGMWIRASAAGQGLGTAALRALLRWGFTEWPWARLSWRCVGRNGASQRTAQKAGMVQEGILRAYERQPDGSRDDMIYFAMLREEWLAQGAKP